MQHISQTIVFILNTSFVFLFLYRTASSRLERLETRPGDQSLFSTTAGDDHDVSSSSQPFPQTQEQQPRESHGSNHATITTTQTTTETQSNTPPSPPEPPQHPPFVLPSRLHLKQLEVDFLKVKDLCAQTIKVEQLQANQLQVSSNL